MLAQFSKDVTVILFNFVEIDVAATFKSGKDGLEEFGTCGSSSRGDRCEVRTEVFVEVRYGHFFLRKRACRMSTLQKPQEDPEGGSMSA